MDGIFSNIQDACSPNIYSNAQFGCNHGTNNYQIELDDKFKGVYFIEFIADKKVYRKKIIIL